MRCEVFGVGVLTAHTSIKYSLLHLYRDNGVHLSKEDYDIFLGDWYRRHLRPSRAERPGHLPQPGWLCPEHRDAQTEKTWLCCIPSVAWLWLCLDWVCRALYFTFVCNSHGSINMAKMCTSEGAAIILLYHFLRSPFTTRKKATVCWTKKTVCEKGSDYQLS